MVLIWDSRPNFKTSFMKHLWNCCRLSHNTAQEEYFEGVIVACALFKMPAISLGRMRGAGAYPRCDIQFTVTQKSASTCNIYLTTKPILNSSASQPIIGGSCYTCAFYLLVTKAPWLYCQGIVSKQQQKILRCIVLKSAWEGDIYWCLSHKAGLNKGSTSRANMGTSVIYFCRLVLMAYSEPRFTTRMMLTTKKSEGMIVLWGLAWLPPTNQWRKWSEPSGGFLPTAAPCSLPPLHISAQVEPPNVHRCDTAPALQRMWLAWHLLLLFDNCW